MHFAAAKSFAVDTNLPADQLASTPFNDDSQAALRPGRAQLSTIATPYLSITRKLPDAASIAQAL